MFYCFFVVGCCYILIIFVYCYLFFASMLWLLLLLLLLWIEKVVAIIMNFSQTQLTLSTCVSHTLEHIYIYTLTSNTFSLSLPPFLRCSFFSIPSMWFEFKDCRSVVLERREYPIFPFSYPNIPLIQHLAIPWVPFPNPTETGQSIDFVQRVPCA